MRPRHRLHPERTTILASIGATLVGGGLVVVAFGRWEFKAAGGVALVLGLYVFLHFFFPEKLRLPEPRITRRPAPAALAGLPFLFPSPRAQLNDLVNEGDRLRRGLPAQANPNDLVAGLVGALTSHQYLWGVARWQERAGSAVRRLAPNLTALFNDVDIPALNYDSMRDHMDARLRELRDVMRALPA